MQAIAKVRVMELGKSLATLEFVKIVMNSIFVDKSLPCLSNFTFIIFFFCFSNSLYCYSNLHHICFFFRSSFRFSQLNFGLMTFFQVKKLEGFCNIRQSFFGALYLLNILSSFTMSLLQPPQSFKYIFFFSTQGLVLINITSSSQKSHVSNPFSSTSSPRLGKPFVDFNTFFLKPILENSQEEGLGVQLCFSRRMGCKITMGKGCN